MPTRETEMERDMRETKREKDASRIIPSVKARWRLVRVAKEEGSSIV